MSFAPYLQSVKDGKTLSGQDMESCIRLLMEGSISHDDAAAFLTALAKRGETSGEIAGAARALRSLAKTIDAPKGTIDCCGTGGDGHNTYNISTAVALVSAACGVPVAKHGNRSASSKSGAADVLEQLGVNLSLPEEKLAFALRDLNFCFLMAPNHHAAMRNVAPVRKSLGFRTIFNLLGPLANPAGTRKQLIGVYDKKWLLPLAEALLALGTEKAMVVHGEDGLDEITLTGQTHVAFLDNGKITQTSFLPQDFGLETITLDSVRGGDAGENARALLNVLKGEHNAYRAMVLANTAAVLMLHDGRDLKSGVRAAAEAIDTGKAFDIFNRYREFGE